MFRQVFLLILLGLAMVGLTEQAIAGPMPCSSLATSDADSVEMSHCDEMGMTGTTDDSDKSNDCCGNDCIAMLQCSQTTATFLDGAAFAATIAVKAMSHTHRLFGNPAGLHRIPEIKPPIIA